MRVLHGLIIPKDHPTAAIISDTPLSSPDSDIFFDALDYCQDIGTESLDAPTVASVSQAPISQAERGYSHGNSKSAALVKTYFAHLDGNTGITGSQEVPRISGATDDFINDSNSNPKETSGNVVLLQELDTESQLRPTLISRTTSIDEVVEFLIGKNCNDITRELDFGRCSVYPFSRGGFGMVHKGVLHRGETVAIKCVEASGSWGAWTPQPKSLKHTAHEIYTWSRCKHPGIIPFLGFARHGECILLISPWMDNGSLADYIERYPRCNRFRLSMELTSALVYIHDMGMVHGDIRVDNILISGNGSVQLGDFGSATLPQDATVRFTQTGVKGYLRFMAPELLTGASNMCTIESDIYALGMIVWAAAVDGGAAYPEADLPGRKGKNDIVIGAICRAFESATEGISRRALFGKIQQASFSVSGVIKLIVGA
ncbi:hypothetical protein RSOLAG22IIIB_11389 [Rhizoctonia solani]|uniref:Protein kinase domain-containing protein n=1 Tax=Rhizoctonia solani TaxID=456999 RepID=A0A0K6G7R7_9AGAM|nr:hypothetical protein RSOLAG22IIIB_11389 [Rhizoctonia solani]